MSVVRGRYAPSPTGPLHLGNVRTALVAWLQARLSGGAFVMRMEDLDGPRCVDGAAEEILKDLYWLGLDWDEGPDVGGPFGPYTQSQRFDLYEESLAKLREEGMLFECLCSRKDIAEASSAPHGYAPTYPGTCRNLTPAELEARQSEKPDRIPAIRVRAEDLEVVVHDRIQGEFRQNIARDVGDFVLKRTDGLYAYQLAVVVDDILMGITDVVRGADLLDSSPRQAWLMQKLGYEPPRYWHVPLMNDGKSQKMSKRDGALSIASLKARGYRPQEVVGVLAVSLGLQPTSDPISAAELLGRQSVVDIQHVYRTIDVVDDRLDMMLAQEDEDGA